MEPQVSQTPDAKPKLIETVFDKVSSPIQLASFIFAIAFGAIIFQVSPGANLIAFVILLLPFVLLFVVVDKKILDAVSNGGPLVAVVVGLIIIGSFVTSILVGVMLVRSSREGLIQTPNNALLEPSRKAKVQNYENLTIPMKITTYLSGFALSFS